MKAVVLPEIGSQPIVTDTELPELREGWVRLKVIRSALCYRDLLTIKGFFPQAKPPLILGHEFTGEVVESRSRRYSKGDRVVALPYTFCGECEYCLTGRENLCRSREWYGEHLHGSHAEYIDVREESLLKISGDIEPNYSSIASCVIGMIINGLDSVGGINTGDKVVVTGASGGVGIHAVQVAKAYGAYVIGVTRSREKEEFIYSAGADQVVYSPGFSKEVKKIGGADVVIETVGEPTFIESLRSLKWGGRAVVIGNVNVKPVELPLGLVILRQNTISGDLSSTKKTLYKAIRLYRDGQVKAIGREMRLEDFETALQHMEKGLSRGRVFLKPW